MVRTVGSVEVDVANVVCRHNANGIIIATHISCYIDVEVVTPNKLSAACGRRNTGGLMGLSR